VQEQNLDAAVKYVNRQGGVSGRKLQLARLPGLEAKTATRAVNALRDAGLIEQHGRGDWQVTDPLLRRYLTEL
jgi:DNA-binding IclR family transcriptional regulator